MLGCRRVRERLFDLLDQELGQVESAMVRSHLCVCSSCRLAANDAQALLDCVRRSCEDFKVPPGLAERIQRVLDDATR
ncbi:MAG TPA: zf-HC2 domain-containing protein [Fimbriimonadaceae bacterium]|nr:zf-HC2 domain-containing protein [Fimbriimonadaceae bacterium]